MRPTSGPRSTCLKCFWINFIPSLCPSTPNRKCHGARRDLVLTLRSIRLLKVKTKIPNSLIFKMSDRKWNNGSHFFSLFQFEFDWRERWQTADRSVFQSPSLLNTLNKNINATLWFLFPFFTRWIQTFKTFYDFFLFDLEQRFVRIHIAFADRCSISTSWLNNMIIAYKPFQLSWFLKTKS